MTFRLRGRGTTVYVPCRSMEPISWRMAAVHCRVANRSDRIGFMSLYRSDRLIPVSESFQVRSGTSKSRSIPNLVRNRYRSEYEGPIPLGNSSRDPDHYQDVKREMKWEIALFKLNLS